MKETEEQYNERLDLSKQSEHRRKLYWLIGLVSTGLFSIAAFVTVVASSLQFFVLMPLETYDSIDGESYESINVNQMSFESPEDFQTAEASLKETISNQRSGDNPVPYYLLGSLYQTLNRTEEAIQHYKDTIKLGVSSWYNQTVYQYFTDDARGALAIIYYENNNSKAALQELLQIRDIESLKNAELLLSLKDSLEDPQRADYHLVLGKNLRGILKLGKAREEFAKAVKLSTDPFLKLQAGNYLKTQMPQHVRELSPLVRYYSLAGDVHETNQDNLIKAANFYELALKEMPNFELGYNDLAIVYRQLKDYNKASSYAKTAVALNPNFYNPYLTLGDIELDRAKYQEAVQYFSKAKEIISRLPDEDNRQIQANLENQLGFAYELMQDSEKALKHYQEAIKKSAGDDFEESQEDYDYADAAIKRLSETASRQNVTTQTNERLSSL